MTMPAFHRAAFALLAAFACHACEHAPPPAARDTVAAPPAAAARTPDRKAIAAGIAAAHAYARSQGLSTNTGGAVAPERPPDDDGYAELDWLKMMPAKDLEALKNPPLVRHVGSQRMKQFGSYDTVPGVTGARIKLPGYVVPLESDDQGRMTEFFFVPFFGACIHVPPPPPNQLVHVKLAAPVKTPQIWDPYWLRGELRIETVKNRVAGSAYAMDDATLAPYDG